MITDGLQILVIGMGVVFLILFLLVWSTMLTSWIIKTFGLDRPAEAGAAPQIHAGGVAAAISAAIARFRSERKAS